MPHSGSPISPLPGLLSGRTDATASPDAPALTRIEEENSTMAERQMAIAYPHVTSLGPVIRRTNDPTCS